MKDVIMNLFDTTGLMTVLISIYMNITAWLNITSWNKAILLITSILGLVYLGMKIYHQFLVTKEMKRKQGGKELI